MHDKGECKILGGKGRGLFLGPFLLLHRGEGGEAVAPFGKRARQNHLAKPFQLGLHRIVLGFFPTIPEKEKKNVHT